MSSDSDEFDSFPDLPLSSSFYERLKILEQTVPSNNSDTSLISTPNKANEYEDSQTMRPQVAVEAVKGLTDHDALSLMDQSEADPKLERKGEQVVRDELPLHDGSSQPSLFAQFRKRGFFSITDLTAPTWCEVQYQYGLLGRKHLPPSERPTSIITPKGNVIELDTSRAIENHKTMEQGTKIHAALEKEIHPVQIRVKVATREETWALRIITMLSSLEALMTLGICREMPVMGFINGFLVMGIIDEIQRRPISIPQTPPGKSPTARSPIAQQTSPKSNGTLDASGSTITNWFKPRDPPSESKKPEENTNKRAQEPMYTLFISDSKTRQTRSLPKEDASLAGKLQVQAYKLLLDNLLLPILKSSSPSPSQLRNTSFDPMFSWSCLFSHLGLNKDALLSSEFQQEVQLVIDGNGLRFFGQGHGLTLDLLTDIWDRYVDLLGINRREGCNRELSLVYRWQFAQDIGRKAIRKESRRRATAEGERRERKVWVGKAVQEEEERGLMLAIRESLVQAEEMVVEDETGKEEAEELKRAIAISLEVAKEEAPPSPVSRPQTHMSLIADIDDSQQQPILALFPSSVSSTSTSTSTVPSTTQSTVPSSSPDTPNIFQTARMESPRIRKDLPSSSYPASSSQGSASQIFEKLPKITPDQHSRDIALPTEVYTSKVLTRMKRVELQALARNKGLPASGLKAELVDRLKGLSVETQSDGEEREESSESPSGKKRSRIKSPGAPPNVLSDSCARPSCSLSTTSSTSSDSSSSSSEGASESRSKENSSDIIGIIRFTHSAQKIKNHLEDILRFWLGEREPRGVTLDHTSRCDWCEFKDGCEWREGQRVRLWEELQLRKNNKGQKVDW